MNCQFDGCTIPATFHITDQNAGQTLHYCETHAREHLASLAADQAHTTHQPQRKIDFDTYCSACGHDDQSHEPAEPSSAFCCPACSRSILNITGTNHAVITDTDLPRSIMRGCRIIPVAENDGLLTVAFDFVDLDMVEKTRFITNTDFLVVYAEPKYIDSLIENHL